MRAEMSGGAGVAILNVPGRFAWLKCSEPHDPVGRVEIADDFLAD